MRVGDGEIGWVERDGWSLTLGVGVEGSGSRGECSGVGDGNEGNTGPKLTCYCEWIKSNDFVLSICVCV